MRFRVWCCLPNRYDFDDLRFPVHQICIGSEIGTKLDFSSMTIFSWIGCRVWCCLPYRYELNDLRFPVRWICISPEIGTKLEISSKMNQNVDEKSSLVPISGPMAG